jgi:hypothetical protein
VAESIARLPEKSRIGGVPRSVRYYIDERRLGRVDSRPIAQATAILQNEYDYVVLHTLDGQPSPVWDLPALLRTDDGYILVETRRIGPTASASVQEPQADSRR